MHNSGLDEPRCAPALIRVTDHIKRHLAEPLSLQTLAELAGLSPWRFSIVFRRHMGVPPHRYISLCRIEHARELLQQGVSAATVADACGFYDQSHFTRHFKHHCGMTPGQYAQHPASTTTASRPAEAAIQMTTQSV
jgi:AraC-like DNA-binding protein